MGRRLVPHMWASPQGCLRVLRTWQLASLRASDLNENKVGVQGANVFYDPTWGVNTPLFLQHPIGYYISPIQCGGELPKSVNTRGQESRAVLQPSDHKDKNYREKSKQKQDPE